MYAIIELGAKQYRVEKGDVIDVELINDSKDTVEIKEVLLVKNEKETTIGSPYVKNATVKAKVVDQVRGPKVIAFKYFRRKDSKKKIGHRQDYTRIEITDIIVG